MHTILPIFLLLCAPVAAQQSWLSEDFDSFPPAGWTTTDNGVGGWADASGVSYWRLVADVALHDSPAGQADSRLISPAMDFSAASGQIWLHWFNWLNHATNLTNHPSSAGNGDSTVEVSLDGGLTWTQLWQETATAWRGHGENVDLSSYAGQSSVMIAWRYQGDNAHEVAVDEVRVDSTKYGINRSVVNPANGIEYVLSYSYGWADAQAAAAELGGQIATAHDAAEDQFLFSTFAKSATNEFVQRRLKLAGSDAVVEGTWEWLDGTPWSYTNWDSGYPSNSTATSDYLTMFSTGLWRDQEEAVAEWVVLKKVGPILTFSGSCPGIGTVSISGATPLGPVFLARSFVAANYTLPTSACIGTQLGITNPVLLMNGTADQNGNWSAPANAPANACGLVHVQGIDYASCEPTNVLSL